MAVGLLNPAWLRTGLLGLGVGMGASAAQQAQPQPAPERRRVSGWRVLDRVLGGDTISEGLDAERVREQAIAEAPRLRQERASILSAITDPRERALFMQSPERWAENVGYQFRPRTLAPGSVERVGGQTVGAAPVTDRFDDRFGVFDPMNPQGGVQYTAPREPTFAEQTDRMKLTQPVNVGRDTDLVDPATGRAVYQGPRSPQEIGQSGQLYVQNPDGSYTLAASNTNPRPMSSVDRRQMFEDQEIVQALSGVNERLQGFAQSIDSGAMNLGPLTNMISSARNAAGMSDENSRNYASFRAELERLRNESLRLNSGVQTEGDAQRAWNELFQNLNDERLVRQRIGEITQINERALAFRRARLEDFGQSGQPSPSRPSVPPPPPGFILD